MAQRIVIDYMDAWKRIYHVSTRVCSYDDLNVRADSRLSDTVHLPETIRLKNELFGIDAVDSVRLGRTSIAVVIGPAFEWDEVQAEIIAAITRALKWTGKIEVR